MTMLTNVLLSLLLSVNVPEGFQVDVFAKGLDGPRAILALEDGTVLRDASCDERRHRVARS